VQSLYIILDTDANVIRIKRKDDARFSTCLINLVI